MEVFAAPWEMRDFPCCRVGVNWEIPSEISNPLIIPTLGSALQWVCAQGVLCLSEVMQLLFAKTEFLIALIGLDSR